jgi:beta-N-acetylhexosaminidase
MSNPAQWDVFEKAAQCVFPRLDTEKYVDNDTYKADINRLVDMNIGGFCIFGGNPEQVEQMIHTLQARAKTPLLMSADFENGLPMRLSEGTDFPHALGLGYLSYESVFKVAQAIAKEASGMGIRWNLAPVADVNTNPDNPIINIRSFGDDPEKVAQHVKSYIEGTQVEKVLACAKHFPGHGDTSKDSHLELPSLDHPYERLSRVEFEPFREAIATNVASIMLGHLSVPSIDISGIPASLSAKVISILQNDLNFKGLIVTDALDMKAITDNYPADKAAILAIEAGNHIALMPETPELAIAEIAKFAENNIDFHEKLDIAVRKIVFYKRKFGLIPQYQILEEGKNLYMNHSKMALKYAYEIIQKTGETSLIPIPENTVFAGFAFVEKDKEFRAASRHFTMLAQATENDCDFAYINTGISDDEIEQMCQGVKDASIVIFTIFYRGISIDERDEKIQAINHIIDKIAYNKKKILLLFGNPYIKDYLKSDLFVLTFSDAFSSLAASVVLLTGREEALDF